MNDLMLFVLMSPVLGILAIMIYLGRKYKKIDRDEKRRDRVIRKKRILDNELKWEFDNKVDKVIIRGNSRDQEIIDYVNKLVKKRDRDECIN